MLVLELNLVDGGLYKKSFFFIFLVIKIRLKTLYYNIMFSASGSATATGNTLEEANTSANTSAS